MHLPLFGWWAAHISDHPAVGGVTGLIAATAILAWLLHVLVERPFLTLRDRWDFVQHGLGTHRPLT